MTRKNGYYYVMIRHPSKSGRPQIGPQEGDDQRSYVCQSCPSGPHPHVGPATPPDRNPRQVTEQDVVNILKANL